MIISTILYGLGSKYKAGFRILYGQYHSLLFKIVFGDNALASPGPA